MASKNKKDEKEKTKKNVKKEVVEKDKTSTKKNSTKTKKSTPKTNTTKKSNTNIKKSVTEDKKNSVKSEKKIENDVKDEVETKVIDNKKNKKDLEKTLKNERKKIDSVGMFDSDISGKIIIVCVIICVFCAFYFLTVFISKDNGSSSSNSSNNTSTNSSSSSSSSTSISYDNIVIGRSFSMDDSTYLVIYYDSSDTELSSTISSLISSYKSKDSHLPIYRVDMSDGLNKNYVSDESNTNPSSVDDMRINGPTLIKFVDNSVDEYIEGKDSISDYLG